MNSHTLNVGTPPVRTGNRRKIYTLSEHVHSLLHLQSPSTHSLNQPYVRPSLEGTIQMIESPPAPFSTANFLGSQGPGRKIVYLQAKQAFFSQGNPANSVYYLQKGRAKLTVVSKTGKEATITLLNVGDFIGEESIAAMVGLRMATATAITACTALKIDRAEMIRVMHEEHAFSDFSWHFC
jgi:CRP/FNR family cyclic AMP-dependent transcriptional regulator